MMACAYVKTETEIVQISVSALVLYICELQNNGAGRVVIYFSY
jgi:hypothetical protein